MHENFKYYLKITKRHILIINFSIANARKRAYLFSLVLTIINLQLIIESIDKSRFNFGRRSTVDVIYPFALLFLFLFKLWKWYFDHFTIEKAGKFIMEIHWPFCFCFRDNLISLKTII